MSPRLVVVSADPGIITGWAVHRLPARCLAQEGLVPSLRYTEASVGQFRMGNTSANVDAFLKVARTAYEEITDEDDYFAVVTESFILTQFSMDPEMLEPVRFNAVLADRLRGTGQGLEQQSPSEVTTTINNARLALWGQLDRSSAVPVHGRDAQRHGLYYARRFVTDSRVRDRLGWKEAA